MRAREEREGRPWNEEWEFQQQDEKEVFRPDEKKMEFARRRVTDMPTNRDIRIPDPAEPNIETVLDNISCKVITVANNYIKNKCDNKGNILHRNLKPDEQRGLRSLMKKVREKELIVQKTDKGGDLALNSTENYLDSLRPHFQSDPDLSWDDHAKLESELNASLPVCPSAESGGKVGTLAKSKECSHFTCGPDSNPLRLSQNSQRSESPRS